MKCHEYQREREREKKKTYTKVQQQQPQKQRRRVGFCHYGGEKYWIRFHVKNVKHERKLILEYYWQAAR